MAASGKTELEQLTRADFEDWETKTRRSPRVVTNGVTTALRVVAAMGYMTGESPRNCGGRSRKRASWGRTASAIAATFERFLGDFATTRRPGTVDTYVIILRRFGDWLGEFDPTVQSVTDIRRHHIEAYKRMVDGMKVGAYADEETVIHAGGHLGQPISAAYKVRCLSCVRTFFETIDALEYDERPGRQLFLRRREAA